MLDLFTRISEPIHIERTDPETEAESQLYPNTQAYIYRGRDNTELGSVVEELNEFTVYLMESTPLDIRVGDVVVRGNGDELRVRTVDNYDYQGFSFKAQRLITEQATV